MKKYNKELDERQLDFLKYYLDRKSKTFSNAYQSAIRAGYSEEYAKNMFSRNLDWLSDNVRTEELVKKAEKRINNLLDSGEERIQLDATKFVLSRLNKKKWSERTEVTGANGEPLILPSEIINKNGISSSAKDNSERQSQV